MDVQERALQQDTLQQKDMIKQALNEARGCLEVLLEDADTQAQIAAAATVMIRSLKSGGKIISCGNGGSLCDAMHFAEELSGRFRADRPALAALSISEPGFLTCAGNDFGYEKIFSRFVQAHLKPNDVLLAISTSGKSANVLEAAKAAREIGGQVVGLTGRSGSPLAALASPCLVTPGAATGWADRVQELHIKIIHIWIELIEQGMFGAGA